jgi:hypothetical protein
MTVSKDKLRSVRERSAKAREAAKKTSERAAAVLDKARNTAQVSVFYRALRGLDSKKNK